MTTPSNEFQGDTPATSPDPQRVPEGDSDQLTQDDTLLDRGVDDALDEGYSPPERPPGNRLETHLDQAIGERLDDKLAQEQPEVWETADAPDAGAAQADRAGRLAVADAESTGLPADSVAAQDVGIGGGAASAEEAAMHIVDDPDLTDSTGPA